MYVLGKNHKLKDIKKISLHTEISVFRKLTLIFLFLQIFAYVDIGTNVALEVSTLR